MDTDTITKICNYKFKNKDYFNYDDLLCEMGGNIVDACSGKLFYVFMNEKLYVARSQEMMDSIFKLIPGYHEYPPQFKYWYGNIWPKDISVLNTT